MSVKPSLHVMEIIRYHEARLQRSVSRVCHSSTLARSGEIFDIRAAALDLECSQTAFSGTGTTMMVRLWPLTLVLFSIASTSGFQVHNGEHLFSPQRCKLSTSKLRLILRQRHLLGKPRPTSATAVSLLTSTFMV